MTLSNRQLLITVILAAVAGLAGAWLGTHGFSATAEVPPSLALRTAIDELAKRGLVGLTDDQKQRLADVELRYSRRRSALRTRMAAANIELADALHDNMSMGAPVEASIEHLKTLVGELQHDTVAYILELRAILTPAQQAIFDEKVMQALITPPR